MSKNRIVFTLAIVLILIPLLGFTTGQLKSFSFIIGAILLGLTFSQSIQGRTSSTNKKSQDDSVSPMFIDGHGSSHSETP